MLITLDITQAQYRGTGVGEYTHNLVSHLLQLNSGHQIRLFGGSLRGFRPLQDLAADLSAPARLYPIPPTALDWFFNRLHWPPVETFTGPTDIFHASDWAQPPARHAKLVTTVHDITPLLFPHYHHPKVVAAFKRRMSWVAKEASAIITDSNATKLDLLEHFPIPESRLTTIYLAASPDFTRFARQSSSAQKQAVHRVLRQHSLTAPYFLFVGTREPRKNLDRTVQAFLQFTASNPGAYSLVIAGKTGWGQTLVDQTHKHIRTLGFVSQADLPALVSAASVFVYPSLYEGFGLPVLEALTLGVPVVTSKRGSLGEVAGKATVLVDPESVTSIAKGFHQALAQSRHLRVLGPKQAAKFTWQKTASQTLKVYERLHAQS